MLKLQLLTQFWETNNIKQLTILTCVSNYFLKKYVYMAIFSILLLCLYVPKSVFEAAEDTINTFNEWKSELLIECNDLRQLIT